jgi:PAS domain S-box-containing protein
MDKEATKEASKKFNVKELLGHIDALRQRLSEANETLDAIRSGAVDGIVVSGPEGEKVFTLQGADHPYRVLIEAMHEGAVVVSTDGVILYSNQAFASLLGVPLESILGKPVRDFVDPRDLAVLDSLLKHTLKGSVSELTLLAMSGAPVSVLISISKFSSDRIESFCMIVTDLSEQKRRDQIVASEEFLRVTFNHLLEGIIICDQEERILRANQAAIRIAGINPTGQSFDEAFPLRWDDEAFLTPPAEEPQRHLLSSLFKDAQARMTEASLQTADGRFFNLLVSVQPLNGAGIGKGWVVTMSDITDRKKTEAELLKISKLESLGLLAGGMAHDFNNFLAVMVGNISLSKILVDPDSKVANHLEEAQKVALQAQAITRQLLAFSKGGVPAKETISIAGLIKDSAGFGLQGSNVQCRFSIQDDLWPIEADEGQIRQAIHNLVLNARQAMPQGGIIQIQAKNVILGSEASPVVPDGEYVKISIKDQGPGIPKENLEKIFDPFFTTKSKGSGLGLTSSYWIIKRHQGHISVVSEPGAGATFHVYLQRSTKVPSEGETTQDAILLGRGKVLFMDDDPAFQKIAREILASLGYEVDCCGDGGEAIEYFREAEEKGRPFDAVILDLTVRGGMGGKETIGKLLEIDPQAKVIVSSGYANDPALSEFKEMGFSGRIAKPYTVEKLSRTLNEMLAGETNKARRRTRNV